MTNRSTLLRLADQRVFRGALGSGRSAFCVLRVPRRRRRSSCTTAVPNYAARAAEARVSCRWEAPPKGIVTPPALTIWADGWWRESGVEGRRDAAAAAATGAALIFFSTAGIQTGRGKTESPTCLASLTAKRFLQLVWQRRSLIAANLFVHRAAAAARKSS